MFAASKTDGAVAAAQADPFFNNVAALLNTSGTNGAQNNTFIDSSTNNFTITRNGNTTQGSFSPYGEDWSNYFDGTGDYLSLATNAAFGYGTGAFTIECWFNSQSLPPSGADYLFDQRTGTIQAALLALITPSGQLEIYVNAALVISGGTFALNTWNHFALSRSGTTTRMFLNGVQIGNSYTDNTNYLSTTPMVIGARFSAEDFYQGYISNFRVIKGTALYTANFTPSTVPLQPVAGTVLLTCKDPNIVDDSANRFTITRNGDVSVQKFGPFSGVAPTTPYFSGYFDGTGDELNTPTSAAFNLGEGDFTIEMWVNLDVTNVQGQYFFYCTGFNPNMFLWDNGVIYLRTAQTSGEIVTPTASGIVAQQWTHVACVRSGNNYSIYINGNLLVSGSSTGVTSVSKQVFIGKNLRGYISNWRLVKGQALYTSNFTPSTSPLTTTSQGATASNVSLLTLQSNTFIDNSPNNFTLTVAGNPQPTMFAPFAVTYTSLQPYTPAVFGGSGYFDGNGDYVTAPANAAFQLTGDFTVEAWVYPTAVNSFNMVFGSENGANSDYLVVRPTTIELAVSNAAYPAWSQTFVVNQWYHVAVTRQSNTLRAFVNGVQLTLSSGSATNSSQFFQSGAPIAVGRYGNTATPYNFTGYISSARIIKGTALYTSSFVPQNTPLTAVTNTSLLLNATNAGIYDAATLNDFETVGNAQVSTSVKVYGTSSVAFDGNGDYLTTVNKPFIATYSGNFTIECWFYLNTVSGTQTIVTNRNGSSGTNAYVPFIFWTESNLLKLYVSSDNSSWNVINGATITTVGTGQWYHLAYTRSGSSCRVFINGVSAYTFTSSAVFTTANPLQVGMTGPGETNSALNGYVQDLRITNGVARYTTNFTPPTAPLPTF